MSGVSPWFNTAKSVDDWMAAHHTVVCATSSSLISTFTGFPLDSLKSRLQSAREPISLPKLTVDVIREEGLRGLWRGSPLPLVSIAIVRTISFTIYTSTKDFINRLNVLPVASMPATYPTINTSETKAHSLSPAWNSTTLLSLAITSSLAGGASGSMVSIGSAPFELVKVRRQLEYQIERDKRVRLLPRVQPNNIIPRLTPQAEKDMMSNWRPPGTWDAVKDIYRSRGIPGLWTGFRLHFVRDTLGTSLYFAEYDALRYVLGRDSQTGKQGQVPEWARGLGIGTGSVAFGSGAVAGVTSWALIYPVDAIKTKHQQRALTGLRPRPFMQQLSRLVRGTDEANPKPLLIGIGRLYRGLGISMLRSVLTHGLLWTLIDNTKSWIDSRPLERYVQ